MHKPVNKDQTTYLEKTTKIKIKKKRSSRCPKLYGLLKIHKSKVSAINFLTQKFIREKLRALYKKISQIKIQF